MTYTTVYNENYAFPMQVTRVTTPGGSYSTSYLIKANMPGSRTGTKVENWAEKIRSGLNATSPFTVERSKVERMQAGYARFDGLQHDKPAPGNPKTKVTEEFYGFNSYPYGSPTHIAVSEAKANAIALTRTYNKIREEMQHMNSPAVLAEFGDVLRQFGAPAGAIVDLTNRRLNRLYLESRGLKGSTTFRRIKWAKIVASTYLEYAFGLAPLISDTRKAAEALARWQWETTGEARFRKAIRSRGEDESVQLNFGTPTRAWNCQFIYVNNTWRKVTTCSVQYCVGLSQSLQADFGSNDRLKQLLGFTPGNWVPALWEVVPWSWLVDYFTNIQQILDACVTSQVNVTWVSKTVRTRTESLNINEIDRAYTTASVLASNWDTVTLKGDCGQWKAVRTTMSRTNPGSLGVPALQFELPVQPGQLANMVAVLFSRKTSSSNLWLT